MTVRQLPVSERPRERLVQLGGAALSEQELLACLLGRGVTGESVLVSARRVLARFGSLRELGEASIEQLTSVHGIGVAKAVQVKAAIEIARRIIPPGPDAHRRVIDTLDAAVAVARPLLHAKKQEHLVALLLDARHRLIRSVPVAAGSLTATLVHPREVFREAIAASAAALIVAHNHPSGDPEPSAQDLHLTVRLAHAGEVLGIELLDHLIVAAEGVVSLRARGVFAEDRPGRSAVGLAASGTSVAHPGTFGFAKRSRRGTRARSGRRQARPRATRAEVRANG